ncbi:MAG: hypothetical protein DRJ59_03920 [Thermoprotei archaeon]|nr:MAG: hypothetical protein DRJ59_03920 [Thermoprotei archaeon]
MRIFKEMVDRLVCDEFPEGLRKPIGTDVIPLWVRDIATTFSIRALKTFEELLELEAKPSLLKKAELGLLIDFNTDP